MSIGEVASKAGIRPSALRYYEGVGVLASGSPMARTYQCHLTRQRIIRLPRSRKPAHPKVSGATIKAAMSGPDGKNLTASNGKNPHEITKVKTKNVMSGWRLTADTRSLLSPARE